MLNQLAIVIVGVQNSGKTSTLKHFCNHYFHKTVNTFKIGWRLGLSIFKDRYLGVKINAYFIPASRTEKKGFIKEIYEELDWNPEFMFLAEQLGGSQYSDTIHYLMANGFHVKEFHLSNVDGDGIWDRWRDRLEMEAKLIQRTEEIADYVRGFIKSRI